MRQEFSFFERDYDNISLCSAAATEVFIYSRDQSCANTVLYLSLYIE